MRPSRWVTILAGAGAGSLSALVVGTLLAAQGMTAPDTFGVTPAGVGVGLYLLLSVPLGAVFGAIFGYRPNGYGAAVGGGLLLGVLWWILRSLTLLPLLTGQEPTWSLAAATEHFPFLVGDLLFGGTLGLGLTVLAPQVLRWVPALVREEAAPDRATRVVILGGGFGGASTARELERVLARSHDVEVTLVSHGNYLLFTPMLAEVASSALEPQHISAPLRATAPRTIFRRAEVEAVDTVEQVVWLGTAAGAPAERLTYDHLVVALGGIPDFRGLPGVEEHAFTLKTLDDAILLRNHVIGLLEQADAEPDSRERRRLLTFVVAGGGFAGAELVAELFDLVNGVLRYYPNISRDELQCVLVHAQDRILPELSPELAGYALRKLKDKGIAFRLSRRVAAMTPEAVHLDDGSEQATRTLVWTAGNQPNPIMRTLGFECTRGGAITCHPTLRVRGSRNVWAIGDCAAVPNPDEGGVAHPPTAQHALRQGKAVARNIAAVLRGSPPKRFRFRSLGMLVVLGHQQAAAEIRGFKFSGPVAWLMWRGIYLSKLPGLDRKVRVLLDWTLELFFPRDIVLTRVARGGHEPDMLGGRDAERVA